MISGKTTLIAHLGYPTEAFKAPMIYNPWFEQRGIDAVVVPVGVKPEDYPATLAVAYPPWRSTSEIIAAERGIAPVYPGSSVDQLVIVPIPTAWLLRPVSSAARVGEQSAVTWNRVNRSPSLARLSSVGVGIGPPNVDVCP